MSEPENKYEFRQPVEVFRDGQWVKGVVIGLTENDTYPTYVHAIHPDKSQRSYWQMPDHIRPDPDFVLVSKHTAPPARTGWRLPEPGDVVRVHSSEKERKISAVDWTRGDPVQTEDGLWWFLSSCKLIRLHDAPAVAAEPETAKPAEEPDDDDDEMPVGGDDVRFAYTLVRYATEAPKNLPWSHFGHHTMHVVERVLRKALDDMGVTP